MDKPCYRPTTLKLASTNCPRAVDFYEQNLPRFREYFSQGIAAHDCLAAIGELAKTTGRQPDMSEVVQVCDSVARRLITDGRTFEGEREPPMPAEDAYQGRVLAVEYAMSERTTWPVSDVWYERGLAFDEAWRPVRYDAKNRRFRLILDMMFITEDGGEDYSGRVAVVRDYKSSWATDESEISTFQMKAQAVAASLVLPDLDGVRREAVNLRTRQTFGETLWLEQGGREQLAEWRDEITAYMDALDKMRDANGQRPTRPGAGCLSCAWVMHCDFAAPMADSAMALAQLLAQNEGRRAQLIKMLKGAASEKPIEFDTTSVGYHVKPKREPKPDATRLAWEEWKKHKGDIDGFIAALRPSLGGLENVAELLVKKSMGKHEAPPESMDALDMAMLDRIGPAIDASAAASLAAQWIETKNGREFGVQRKV